MTLGQIRQPVGAKGFGRTATPGVQPKRIGGTGGGTRHHGLIQNIGTAGQACLVEKTLYDVRRCHGPWIVPDDPKRLTMAKKIAGNELVGTHERLDYAAGKQRQEALGQITRGAEESRRFRTIKIQDQRRRHT